MPSGLGGHRLSQLGGKDDIEDLVDLVQTEEVRTRHHPSLDRSNVSPIEDELQHLPYHPGRAEPSKDATKIVKPMGSNRPRNRVSTMGPQPGSSLYAKQPRQYGGTRGTPPQKRGLFRSVLEFPTDQSRPKKQRKMVSAMEQASVDSDDDEVTEVHPPSCRNKSVGQESRRLPQSRITSKHFRDSQNLPDEMEVDSKQQEFGKKGATGPGCSPNKGRVIQKGDKGFINNINDLPEVSGKGPTLTLHAHNDPGIWSSQPSKSGGDTKRAGWTSSNKRKALMSLSKQKKMSSSKAEINLLCLKQGTKSYNIEGSQGLFIRVSPDDVLEALYGERGKEQEIWSLDLKDISLIHYLKVHTPSRRFAIKMAHRLNHESDRMVIFTLEDVGDVEDCKVNFFEKRIGYSPIEVEEKTIDNMANELKMWEGIKANIPTEPIVTHQKARQEAKGPQELSHVEIKVRRSPRNRVDKTRNNSSSQPRASPMGDIEPLSREMRSSKLKLELPKPPWKNPLVYPPTGPRKEVVDYDDLKRLNSNSYLNDNIINFYLKYVEVQLRKNNPEVADETHFLNTFFYERLTKRDEKRKRDFDSVLKWTAKVDIFKTSYIIIPINEATHWYLAIICNLCNLERRMNDKVLNSPGSNSIDLESNGTLGETKEDYQDAPSADILDSSDVTEPLIPTMRDGEEQDVEIIEAQDSPEQMTLDDEPSIDIESKVMIVNNSEIIEVEDSSSQRSKPKGRGKPKAKNKSLPKKNRGAVPPDTPSIIILDSMGFGPTTHNGTIRNLREWLKLEAQTKRSLNIRTEDIHAAFGKAPNQNNWYDCGLFLLHYVELFFEKPIQFTSMFLARGDHVSDQTLWRKEEIKGMREKLFHLFIRLHNEQEALLTGQKALPNQQGDLTGNGNESKNQKSGEGNRPSQDLMAMDVEEPAEDKDLQNTKTVSGPTAVSKNYLVFDKFTGELGEFIASDRSAEEDGGVSTNLLQVPDKLEIQPINLEVSNSILQPGREITLPFRENHNEGGVII